MNDNGFFCDFILNSCSYMFSHSFQLQRNTMTCVNLFTEFNCVFLSNFAIRFYNVFLMEENEKKESKTTHNIIEMEFILRTNWPFFPFLNCCYSLLGNV